MGPTAYFFAIFVKFFFLLTPFFVLSVFLSLTRDAEEKLRRRTAARMTRAVILIALVLYFFGDSIFQIFGITLDSFRIGAGALLFLSGVDLVRGDRVAGRDLDLEEASVVPLAIPITVGPATTGALLILGAEVQDAWQKVIGCLALLAAVLAVGLLLYAGALVERMLGRRGITILSRLTGLIIAAISAQLVFTGIRNFLFLQ